MRQHPYRGNTALFVLVPEEKLPKRPISETILRAISFKRLWHMFHERFNPFPVRGHSPKICIVCQSYDT